MTSSEEFAGQLKHAVIDYEGGVGLPSEIFNDLRNLSESASHLANRAIPHVFTRNPDYFAQAHPSLLREIQSRLQFKFLLTRPYDIWHSYRMTDAKYRWKSLRDQQGQRPTGFTERQSDW